jgi:integrase/recombinase XerD
MDYNQAFMSFLTYLKTRNYSPATQRNYRGQLKPFERFLEEKRIQDVRQVTHKDLTEYQESVSKEKISLPTQALRIRAVKRLYEHLMNENHLLMNPSARIFEPPMGVRLPKVLLTPEDVDLILHQPNLSLMVGIRDRAILELLYSTGIRVGECEALTVYDVDIKARLLRIRSGKGRKERVVPLGKEAAQWIKEYLQRVRPRSNRLAPNVRSLFLSIQGAPMTSKMIREMIHKYVRKAKIKKPGITAHTFRHTFATELIKNGADIVSVQKLLGHKDIKSTLIYTRVVPLDIKKTHQETHPREKEGES